jgi:hypothetical protein
LYLGAAAPDKESNGFVDGTDNSNGNATDDDAAVGTGTGNGDDEDNFTFNNNTSGGAASSGEVEDYRVAIAVASAPNLLLVKRITAINPGQADEIQFDNREKGSGKRNF